jgi:hypothetical protein
MLRATPRILETCHRLRMEIARLKIKDPAVVSRSSPSAPFVVARTAAHEQAEQLLASLRRRRKEAAALLDAMFGLSDEKRAASADYAKLNDAIGQVRDALIPMRNRHLENARAAYRAPRRDAAKRALASLKEAETAIHELDVMSAELRRLGGVHPDLKASQVLLYLVAPLERLARDGGKS